MNRNEDSFDLSIKQVLMCHDEPSYPSEFEMLNSSASSMESNTTTTSSSTFTSSQDENNASMFWDIAEAAFEASQQKEPQQERPLVVQVQMPAASQFHQQEAQDKPASLPAHMFFDLVEANAPAPATVLKEEQQVVPLDQQVSHVSACTIFFQMQEQQQKQSQRPSSVSRLTNPKKSPAHKKPSHALRRRPSTLIRMKMNRKALQQGFLNVHWGKGGNNVFLQRLQQQQHC